MTSESQSPYLVMLLSQDLNSPSGLGRYFPLAKYLVRLNYRVTILALHSNFESENKRDFWDQGVHVRYVSQMHVRKSGNETYYFSPVKLVQTSINATSALYREGSKQDADLIFVGKPHPMNGMAGYWLSRRKKLPLIVDCDDYEAESNRVTKLWQKKVLKFFEMKLPRLADLVTTNTYFMREKLIDWGVDKEKIAYLPNGVDTERFTEPFPEMVSELRTELSLDGKRVIGYFGSLNLTNHPVDLLIRSFKLVAEKIDDVVLLIVGGGKDLDYLVKKAEELGIKDKVIFTGRIKPDEMKVYYRLADVSVDPANDNLADRGRCPLKLFESWQMGVPVVTSDVGDRKILAGDPPAAVLTQAGNENDLAQKIQGVFGDLALACRLPATGLERSAHYDWSIIATKFLKEIYRLKQNDRSAREL
ncbi:MAG: glycosyltransferase family 4 protein [Syntrophaceae bacterium]|nr:glycosyltransferase family 4 protein [Syntrophaceae bacterium]